MKLLSHTLSARGQYSISQDDMLLSYLLKCFESPFDADTNPEGIVNMGISVNKLMERELEEKLEEVFKFKSSRHQHYYDIPGQISLKIAAANFFNKYFNVAESVAPENLTVMGGAQACMDALSFALFDPGDVFITPVPTYSRTFTDLNERSLAQPCPVEFVSEGGSIGAQCLENSRILENKIQMLQSEGKRVKGFVMVNPQNPEGGSFSPRMLRSLLSVCARYKIHAVFDEVYALSLLDPKGEVNSILSVPDLPDPQRTHFVWALTKDFGLAGLRVGFIHSRNTAVTKVLHRMAAYSPCPSIIQDATQYILEDTKWLEEVYFPRNRQRLQERYQQVRSRLEALGALVRPAKAGLFVWFNLKNFLNSHTEEGVQEIFDDFFNAGVYITPGYHMYSSEPGWFRMIFSISKQELEVGLRRMESVLVRRKLLLK